MPSHGIKDQVAIVGAACTPFGEHWDRGADDLMVQAADRSFVSCERVVDTGDLLKEGSHHTLRISRLWIDGVVETPNGAHFTSCAPDYERDEAFQREYASSAKSPEAWEAFRTKYVDLPTHAAYLAQVGLS